MGILQQFVTSREFAKPAERFFVCSAQNDVPVRGFKHLVRNDVWMTGAEPSRHQAVKQIVDPLVVEPGNLDIQ